MRCAALIALLLASSTAAAEPRFISLGADALPTAIHADGVDHLDILAANEDIAVLEVDDEDLDAIGREIHETHGRCGGFMLHESRDEALGALQIQRDNRKPIDYTLDRAAVVRSVLPTVDKANILSTIRELQGMGSRYFKSATGAAASTWLAAKWRTFSTRTDIKIELLDHGAYPQKSVVMMIPGTTKADEVIVIGGHLDSIVLMGRSSDAPGADDDASGIATLTEIARALLASDYQPERTIAFVAYAAEEVGLRGSQATVKEFQKRGINVVGALQLDMTNYQGSEKDIWLMKDFTSAAQNDFLIKLIDTYVGATWGLDACGYACSDHASWTKAGVPASMPFEARMRDRNKHIHTTKDTLETSGNNADHAVKFARLGAAYAIELGKGGFANALAIETPTAVPAAPSDDTRWWTLAILALLAGAGMLLSRSYWMMTLAPSLKIKNALKRFDPVE